MLTQLQTLATNVDKLQAIFVIAMPDALLFDSWVTLKHQHWDATEIASYFGDMIRANRRGLKSLSSWSDEMQITVETKDSHLIMHELESDFVVVAIFEPNFALGLIRFEMMSLLKKLDEILPKGEIERRSQGVRTVDFLLRYAPDSHAVLQRVALMTGITIEKLKNPTELNDEDAEIIQEAAKSILGLNQIDI